MEKNEDLIQHLSKGLPQAFGRSAIEKLLPGIISSKTLANLDSAGLGPPSYKCGRKVIYEKGAFLEWLNKRIS